MEIGPGKFSSRGRGEGNIRVEGDYKAQEIDAGGCAVGSGDVGAIYEIIGGGRAEIKSFRPLERVEGVGGGEEVKETLLISLGMGEWVTGLGHLRSGLDQLEENCRERGAVISFCVL